jgi:hypothetical protein
MNGQKLNSSVIKVSPSKTPIVPINRDFMPRDESELERCERTVYVNQIDRAVPGSAVEAMFESFCGARLCHNRPAYSADCAFSTPFILCLKPGCPALWETRTASHCYPYSYTHKGCTDCCIQLS